MITVTDAPVCDLSLSLCSRVGKCEVYMYVIMNMLLWLARKAGFYHFSHDCEDSIYQS